MTTPSRAIFGHVRVRPYLRTGDVGVDRQRRRESGGAGARVGCVAGLLFSCSRHEFCHVEGPEEFTTSYRRKYKCVVVQITEWKRDTSSPSSKSLDRKVDFTQDPWNGQSRVSLIGKKKKSTDGQWKKSDTRRCGRFLHF
jgi:hypothetical protein